MRTCPTALVSNTAVMAASSDPSSPPSACIFSMLRPAKEPEYLKPEYRSEYLEGRSSGAYAIASSKAVTLLEAVARASLGLALDEIQESILSFSSSLVCGENPFICLTLEDALYTPKRPFFSKPAQGCNERHASNTSERTVTCDGNRICANGGDTNISD